MHVCYTEIYLSCDRLICVLQPDERYVVKHLMTASIKHYHITVTKRSIWVDNYRDMFYYTDSKNRRVNKT